MDRWSHGYPSKFAQPTSNLFLHWRLDCALFYMINISFEENTRDETEEKQAPKSRAKEQKKKLNTKFELKLNYFKL